MAQTGVPRAARTEPAGALADLAASFMDIKPKEKQEIVESVDLVARMDKVARASEPEVHWAGRTRGRLDVE